MVDIVKFRVHIQGEFLLDVSTMKVGMGALYNRGRKGWIASEVLSSTWPERRIEERREWERPVRRGKARRRGAVTTSNTMKISNIDADRSTTSVPSRPHSSH